MNQADRNTTVEGVSTDWNLAVKDTVGVNVFINKVVFKEIRLKKRKGCVIQAHCTIG